MEFRGLHVVTPLSFTAAADRALNVSAAFLVCFSFTPLTCVRSPARPHGFTARQQSGKAYGLRRFDFTRLWRFERIDHRFHQSWSREMEAAGR